MLQDAVKTLVLLLLASTAHSFSLSPLSANLMRQGAGGWPSTSRAVVSSLRMQYSDYDSQEISRELREQTQSNLASMRQRIEDMKLEGLKTDLLLACDASRRGLESPAGSEERERIVRMIEELEQLNKEKAPLQSESINGEWTLRWTTSDSVLGRKRMRGFRVAQDRPILQMIDAKGLKAKNVEPVTTFSWIFGGIRYDNSVEAELEPMSSSKVRVLFKQFKIGSLLSFNAPSSARGELDTTYLDDGSLSGTSLRISRGDKGNLFVLTRTV